MRICALCKSILSSAGTPGCCMPTHGQRQLCLPIAASITDSTTEDLADRCGQKRQEQEGRECAPSPSSRAIQSSHSGTSTPAPL